DQVLPKKPGKLLALFASLAVRCFGPRRSEVARYVWDQDFDCDVKQLLRRDFRRDSGVLL
ncbi:MAG: hypothetical protein L0387_32425, partial [Acidobacteria bacterium]|nr:hypothetical protein [Acidobacteriota bacterium]MCI0626300.1 hypothetical protein [Acidobacteriota bacterium]